MFYKTDTVRPRRLLLNCTGEKTVLDVRENSIQVRDDRGVLRWLAESSFTLVTRTVTPVERYLTITLSTNTNLPAVTMHTTLRDAENFCLGVRPERILARKKVVIPVTVLNVAAVAQVEAIPIPQAITINEAMLLREAIDLQFNQNLPQQPPIGEAF